MAFSFGFSGDDIEEDPNDTVPKTQEQNNPPSNHVPPPIKAQTHTLDEMLSTLPSTLSFSTLTLTSPRGKTTSLPRRSLFDTRLQLMAEDDSFSSSTPLTGLDNSDLSTNIYEGGYKTWECSIDLAKHLLDNAHASSSHVVEMGCGSALPSLVLFEDALRRSGGKLHFTLTDYNVDVLRLVTVPNLLLVFLRGVVGTAIGQELFPAGSPFEGDEGDGDVFVTREIVQAFKSALGEGEITFTFVSGSWVPVGRFLDLVPEVQGGDAFVLGSETIYSPASLVAFTEAIVGLMKRAGKARTLVAAKRVYFGVGGSVDGFREECARRGCVVSEVDFEGGEGASGVRRCLLQVQMC